MAHNGPAGLFEIKLGHQLGRLSGPGHILIHYEDLIESEFFIDKGHGADKIFYKILGVKARPENIFVLVRIFLDLCLRSGRHSYSP